MSRFAFAEKFSIAGREVGRGCPAYVIAEAGVAHFGSLEKAFELADLAAQAGADAVKFQVFSAEKLISKASRDWIRRLSSRELPRDDFLKIRDHCEELGITFFATAHDEESLDFLAAMGAPVFKVGSGEVGNWEFLARTASFGKPVILSTGMYAMADVEAALKAVAGAGNTELAVLHCVTSYPTPPEQVNLRAMNAMAEKFKVVAGYSDHTAGFHIPLAAVALGAKVVEKHISLDFNVPDAQDWKVSCGPHDLARFISEIREVEAALGQGEKKPVAAEEPGMNWARKSLVAARHIRAGEIFSREMLAAKRPGTGISPARIGEVLGRAALRDIEADDIIELENLK